jgi:hypothetical protein
LQATRLPLQNELFFSVVDHLAAHRAAVNAGEVLFHRRCQQ